MPSYARRPAEAIETARRQAADGALSAQTDGLARSSVAAVGESIRPTEDAYNHRRLPTARPTVVSATLP